MLPGAAWRAPPGQAPPGLRQELMRHQDERRQEPPHRSQVEGDRRGFVGV